MSGSWRRVAGGELRGPEGAGETRQVGVSVRRGWLYIFRVIFRHLQWFSSLVSSVFYGRRSYDGRTDLISIFKDDGVLESGGSLEFYYPVFLHGQFDDYLLSVTSTAHRKAPSAVGYEVDVAEFELPEGWAAIGFRGAGPYIQLYPKPDYIPVSFPAGGRIHLRVVSLSPSMVRITASISDAGRTVFSREVLFADQATVDIPPSTAGQLFLGISVERGVAGFILYHIEAFGSGGKQPEPGGWVFVAGGELRGPENSGETERVDVQVAGGRGHVYQIRYIHKEFLAARVITSLNSSGGARVWSSDDVLVKGGEVVVYFPLIQYQGYGSDYSIYVTSVASRLAPSVSDYEIHRLEYEFPEGWHVFTFHGQKIFPLIEPGVFGFVKFPNGGRVTVKLVSPFPAEAQAALDIRFLDRTLYRSSPVLIHHTGQTVFEIPRGVEGQIVLGIHIREGVAGFILVNVEQYSETPKPPEKPPEEKPPERPPERPRFPSPWDAIRELLRRVLRDEEPVSREPIITKALIAILYTILTYTASNLNDWVLEYGLLPYAFAFLGAWHGLLTHFWLHAGWEHFVGNALFLYVFGDNVEDRVGYLWYVLLYISAGVVAGLGFVAYQLSVGQPYVVAVGASGAISGVMGAYAVLFPRAHVVFMEKRLPAQAFLALWLVGQFALAFQDTRVSWVAHVVGFIYGVLMGLLLRRLHRAGSELYEAET